MERRQNKEGGRQMKFDFSKLRGRIVEKFRSVSNFAKEIGESPQAVSGKLTGQRAMTKNDIIKWCKPLEIELNEIGEYFFTLKV
jgi:hypothetical protein